MKVLVTVLLEKKYDISYLPPTQIGMIYWGLGEKEKSMEWMEKGYEQKDNFPKMVLPFKPLKNEPWFREWFDLGTLNNPRNPYGKAFIQVDQKTK